jgi:hypothetical protein
MLFTPLEGWRQVEVTDRHAAIHYAQILKALSDRHFRHGSTIVLVQDNLSVNRPKADWQFTTADARIKRKGLYPAI